MIDYEVPIELGEISLVVYDLNGKTIATYNIADKATSVRIALWQVFA